jgi:transcriptional regulator with XRE-family HTH domain
MGLLAKLAAELGVSPEDIVSEEGHSAGAPHHNHNLKAIRRAAGVTQQQLADKAEIPLKTIQDWEQTGRSPRDMQRLVPIAEALGCTVDELLGRTTRGDRLDALEDRLDALEARLAAVEGRTDGTGDAPNAPATDQEIVARIRGILSGGAS